MWMKYGWLADESLVIHVIRECLRAGSLLLLRQTCRKVLPMVLSLSPDIPTIESVEQCLQAIGHATLLVGSNEWDVIYANFAYEEMMSCQQAEITGKRLIEIHEGCWNRSALLSSLQNACHGDRLERIIVEHNDSNGSNRSFEVHHRVAQLGTSRSCHLLSFRDISVIRQLEGAYKRSEARHQALLDSAVDAIMIINTHGAIKAFNPAAERLFGFSSDEVLGLNVNMLMPSPYLQEHDNYLRRYLETKEKRVIGIGREVIGKRKDGTVFPMNLSISEVTDGEERLFVGTVRDITHSKRTEEALRDSEARVRAILGTAVDAIITIDESGLIKSLNSAAQKMFGYSHHEMIGENVRMLMPDPYRGEHDGYLQKYQQTGTRRVIGIGREAVGRRRDGSTFPMELSVSEVRQGSRRYFTGIVRDITERKRYEDRLRESIEESSRSHARLKIQAEELAQQATHLSEARKSAEAANRAKSDFLANMSHEIRTPMTAILGFAEQVSASLNRPEDCEALSIIRRNGEHLLKLINDILDISKIESGLFEIEKTTCDLRALIHDLMQSIGPKAARKKIGLTVNFATNVPVCIEADVLRLKQSLMNLLSNAVKFTEQGGVDLSVRMTEEFTTAPRLQMQICDTGIGIAAEHLDKLFIPFSQADTSVSRRFGGTGLGLAISKRLIELMGGDLQVKSILGSGSSFTITLPTGKISHSALGTSRQVSGPRLTKALQAEARVRDKPLSILLAEDGVDNQKLIGLILRKAGHNLTIAEHGGVAIALYERAIAAGQNIDMILMDMQMPFVDGYEATRRLRSMGCQIPIVALTAHAMVGDREKCLQAGCTEYMTKPIDRHALLQLIDELGHPSAVLSQQPI